MVDELTQYLYNNNMTKYIELYVTKVNPMKTPQVAGALLDADCGEDFVRTLILSVRGMCPAEALVEACESRTSDDFKNNKNLQNLLLLTAIKADPERVMDYINRLSNYDAPDIANIAVGAELYEEALVIFKKHGFHAEAAKVLLEYIGAIERAVDFADKVNTPEVWTMLATAQLKQGSVKEAVAAYIKADDATNFQAVIEATPAAGAWAELASFLVMARKKVKDSNIDSTLLYAYAKCENYVALEEFISAPNVAQIQGIGDRCYNESICYNEGMYEAAKVLFTSNSNWSRLASCLVHLTEYQQAVDAARKANSARTWKEVNAACVEATEFRLAQICAMFIIINPDELESLINTYEQHGFFDEVIALMESGLNLERAHMGIFTELGILYAKYRPEKLMEHIKLFWSKLNIRKLLHSCEEGHHWEELVFLYTHYDEFDNACMTMIKHPAVAFEHVKFKETIAKVTNSEVYYKAISFYLEYSPTLLVDMLTVVISHFPPPPVVLQMRKAKLLPPPPVEDEDHAALAKAIDMFSNFDQIEMAKKCEAHELLQFRRIAAKLYMNNERYDWTTAIQTTSDSGKQELAETLIAFFVKEKNKACFASTLFTCYELLRPDVVMEIAWRNGLTDYAMPFMIQSMRHLTAKVEELGKTTTKIEVKAEQEKKQAEEASIMSYADPSMAAYNGNALTVYGAQMGGGMGMGGGMPQQPQYGGGMGGGYGQQQQGYGQGY
ncbi:armadillo-type protein [Pavlovales sp. CCMP2436]|nr:armadillo-type protein [Pavlovales sp. CCMP2436]